jgi:Dimerisation and cyclophilin-binding domain of Mon2
MNALIGYLVTEFKTILGECKRKHSELKGDLEKSLSLLNKLKGNLSALSSESPSVALQSADLVGVLLSAASHYPKNKKVISSVIGCLQKLITHKLALPSEHVSSSSGEPSTGQELTSILQFFSLYVPGASSLSSSLPLDELSPECLLKILQVCLPLVSNYPQLHQDAIACLFRIGFRLYTSTSMSPPMIMNSASATLRQLVVFLFDKMEKWEPITLAEDIHVSVADLSIHSEEEQNKTKEVKTRCSSSSISSLYSLDAYCVFKESFILHDFPCIPFFLFRI